MRISASFQSLLFVPAAFLSYSTRLTSTWALHTHSQLSKMSTQKIIHEICRKPPAHWVGDGFHVYPVFHNKAFTSELSPFLMFDYAAPKEFQPTTRRRGVGQHPHRGFETVTIAFQGEVEHRDSTGNSGVIGPGDVQWMTAAKGIIHEEFHSTKFAKEGGTFEMCQLWVNLPSSKKMTEPRYQPILNRDIPKVPLSSIAATSRSSAEEEKVCAPEDEGWVRIIAGDFRGTKGPAMTFTPVNLWDVGLTKKDREYELEFVEGHNTLLFVRRGSVEIQGKALGLADVAIMEKAGTKLTVKSTMDDTSLLILSGEPIDEPIAARGPFVMNTYGELAEAMQDYQMGRNGFDHFD